jgi:hypothetical protein
LRVPEFGDTKPTPGHGALAPRPRQFAVKESLTKSLNPWGIV